MKPQLQSGSPELVLTPQYEDAFCRAISAGGSGERDLERVTSRIYICLLALTVADGPALGSLLGARLFPWRTSDQFAIQVYCEVNVKMKECTIEE